MEQGTESFISRSIHPALWSSSSFVVPVGIQKDKAFPRVLDLNLAIPVLAGEEQKLGNKG